MLAISGGDPLPVTAYRVGAVLEPNEKLLVEIPAQVAPDVWTIQACGAPCVRPWLITSERILGRLGDERLAEWRWSQITGCRVDLAPGRENVSLDTRDGVVTRWEGPGVAPLAVVAVARLYGARGLLDHPGLMPLLAPG